MARIIFCQILIYTCICEAFLNRATLPEFDKNVTSPEKQNSSALALVKTRAEALPKAPLLEMRGPSLSSLAAFS
ncbi:MAG: hypothetical protein R2881_10845 [Eubacteriales bacterium]